MGEGTPKAVRGSRDMGYTRYTESAAALDTREKFQ